MFQLAAIAGEQRARIACPLSELDAVLGDLLARNEKDPHGSGRFRYKRESVPGQSTYHLSYQRSLLREAAMPPGVFRPQGFPTGSLHLRELSDAETELTLLTPIVVDDVIQAEYFQVLAHLLDFALELCVAMPASITDADGGTRIAKHRGTARKPRKPWPATVTKIAKVMRRRERFISENRRVPDWVKTCNSEGIDPATVNQHHPELRQNWTKADYRPDADKWERSVLSAL